VAFQLAFTLHLQQFLGRGVGLFSVSGSCLALPNHCLEQVSNHLVVVSNHPTRPLRTSKLSLLPHLLPPLLDDRLQLLSKIVLNIFLGQLRQDQFNH